MIVKFGKWNIKDCEIFWRGEKAYAMVNTKPVVPNHVLVCPLRVVANFSELTPEELLEMNFAMTRILSSFGPSSVAVQDGREAGQTVPHVHFHILPRRGREVNAVDSDRKERTDAEMAEESETLKNLINFN
jgi:bis(5'-adenosyl)-triphosphatase